MQQVTGQDEWLQAVPGEFQLEHEEEFIRGKGYQALGGAVQAGLESPSLEMSKEQLHMALSALGWVTEWVRGWTQ